MMLYVSIGTLFWTHIATAVLTGISCSAYVYFTVKK